MIRIKSALKKILPSNLVKRFQFLKLRNEIKTKNEQYKSKVGNLRSKNKIRVVFFVIHSSVWKYDGLYNLFEKDDLFEPIIVVCPYLKVEKQDMMNEMDKTYSLFKEKKYRVVRSYMSKKDAWIDVEKEYNPDIIFYSVPYTYTREEYQFSYYKNVLNCYVPYFFVTNGLNQNNFDSYFHNLQWKLFYETNIHKQLAKKYARNNADNVVVSGYPGLDHFLFQSDNKSDPWKIKKGSVKRIIWAPHHTIEGQGANLNYSNFAKYHQFFKKILVKFKNEIHVAFKPHPLLKEKLYKDGNWGQVKTDEYYSFWNKQENSMLCDSDYVDLFLTSDALIHDCSSFMAEYLSTGKPSLYLMRDDGVKNRINEFGKIALEQHYKAYNEGQVVSFIEKLLENEDSKKEERTKFVNKYLLPPNGITASENIYNKVKLSLSNE